MLFAAVLVAAAVASGAAARGVVVLPSVAAFGGKSFEAPRIATPLFDADAARARADAAEQRFPLIVAEPFALSATPETAGAWRVGSDGAHYWRAAIEAPGATDVNVHFAACALPDGAELYVSSANAQRTFHPRTQFHCDSYDGQLWTPVVAGERMELELRAPTAAVRAAVRLEIAEVFRGFRSIVGSGSGSGNKKASSPPPALARFAKRQQSCNIDSPACDEAKPYHDISTSVARVLYGGSALCTGTLVMDSDETFAPHFYSAYHCVSGSEDRAKNTVTFWGYESETCGQLCCGNMERQLAVGSKFLWMERQNDGLAITLGQKVHESPDTDNYRAFYAGWSASSTPVTGVVGISHPRGGVKTIALSDATMRLTPSCIGGGGMDTHWHVERWHEGTTEPGSSGSCVFDKGTSRCIGWLSGGAASCSNRAGHDCYGAVWVGMARGLNEFLGTATHVDGKYDPES